MREATRSLDRLHPWRGEKTEDNQRLSFPRDIGDATIYPSDEMHRNIKEAQIELAVLLQAKQDSTTGDIEFRTETGVGALYIQRRLRLSSCLLYTSDAADE